MKVMFACVADQAWVDQSGKLSVSGIFDRITASAFPAHHGKMFLVFRLMLEYEDNDKPHSITFSLTDADGQSMFRANADVKAEKRVLASRSFWVRGCRQSPNNRFGPCCPVETRPLRPRSNLR